MTLPHSRELGISAMACLPNLSHRLRLDITFGTPVGDSKSSGPERLVPACPSTCKSGSFYDEISKECVPCVKGSFAPGMGAAFCLPCAPATYMSQRGATSCTTCPQFATSPLNSSSISDCACTFNYYETKSAPGQTLQCAPIFAAPALPPPSIPAVVLDSGTMSYVVKFLLALPYSAAEFDFVKQVWLHHSALAASEWPPLTCCWSLFCRMRSRDLWPR